MSIYWRILIWTAAIVILLWLVFGINWRGKNNYAHSHRRMYDRIKAEGATDLTRLLYDTGYDAMIDSRFQPLCQLLEQDGRPDVSTTDEVEILTSGKRKYDLLMHDIMDAKESIHIEYFHFGIDKGSRAVRRALMDKAKEGVRVRFINENVANFPIPRFYFNAMRRAGVEVCHYSNTYSLLRFLLSLSYRDHRKIVVIDGKIGYTGGMNINDHYFKEWRDTHLRLTGRSVAQLQFAFIDAWLRIGGRLQPMLNTFFPMLREPMSDKKKRLLTQIVPDDPTSPEPILQIAYEWIFYHAERYVWLQSPYLAPPPSLIDAIRSAVERGIDVRIMLPEQCDTAIMRPLNRYFAEECMRLGVRLYYRGGEFIHSKTIVADDYLSCIGTTNIDNRSFGIDYEINTFFYDRDMALQNKAIFETDLALCREGSLEEESSRNRLLRWYDKQVSRLAPIL